MKRFLLGLTALVMVLTLALSVAVAEASVPRVAALKGPTAMGMVKMMSDAPDAYDFTISAAIDEITPKLVKGEVDIAAVPANMASVLSVSYTHLDVYKRQSASRTASCPNCFPPLKSKTATARSWPRWRSILATTWPAASP